MENKQKKGYGLFAVYFWGKTASFFDPKATHTGKTLYLCGVLLEGVRRSFPSSPCGEQSRIIYTARYTTPQYYRDTSKDPS